MTRPLLGALFVASAACTTMQANYYNLGRAGYHLALINTGSSHLCVARVQANDGVELFVDAAGRELVAGGVLVLPLAPLKRDPSACVLPVSIEVDVQKCAGDSLSRPRWVRVTGVPSLPTLLPESCWPKAAVALDRARRAPSEAHAVNP